MLSLMQLTPMGQIKKLLRSEKPEGKICIPVGNSKENLLFLQ
jgi:hypothetical protein